MNDALRISRRLGGPLKTLLYRRPRDWFHRLRRWGVWNFANARRWEMQMRTAASALPALKLPSRSFPVAFLTGKAFWHQTAFCAWSFCRQTGWIPDFLFVDDGSLENKGIDELRRLFPNAAFQSLTQTRAMLERTLPVARFPALRRKWLNYPNIRKLTDIHGGREGWRLVLDSDMLFFRKPEAILDWIENPRGPLLAREATSAYGYDPHLMERLAGNPVPECLNVGICGLRSDALDWRQLEDWTRELVETAGDSYLLEQGLIAMLAAGNPPQTLPLADYRVLPSQAEAQAPASVLLHYVDYSRPFLFRYGWRQVLNGTHPEIHS